MNAWTPDQVKQKMAELYKKAAIDETFRNLCLREPREAFRQIFGRELPETFRLRFLERDGYDLTLVLPDLQTDGELSDEKLDWVAGGFFPTLGQECELFNFGHETEN